MWDKLIHDFGNVVAGKVIECNFTYTGDAKVIATKGSCGCTVAKTTDNVVNVKFTPRKGTAGYTSSKVVTITMNDKTKLNLRVTAKVYHNDEQIKELDK